MTYGWAELGRSVLATLVLPCFFLFPGYVAGYATDVFELRQKSCIEQLLWACVLSVPITLLLAVHPGIHLSSQVTLRLFQAIALVAIVLAARDLRRKRSLRTLQWDRHATLCVLAVLGLIGYLLLAAVPLQVGHRLYENAAWQDWGLRIQMVNAVLRDPNHPANPMFAVQGNAPALHYYYYWYNLCAQIAVLSGAGARAALSASCIGAAMTLIACIFLYLKYLGAARERLRSQCLAALLTACVLGLDIVPATLRLLLPFKRVYPDIQFWLDDRSPSWLHMLLWAPHHVAGMVCCMAGLLLVLRTRKQTAWQQWLACTTLAGLCFAAAVGTSSYITLLFVLVCLFVVADAALRREWKVVFAMAGAGLIAVAVSAPFLIGLQHSTAIVDTSASHAPTAPFRIAIRYRDQVHNDLRWAFQFKDLLHLVSHPDDKLPPPSLAQKLSSPAVMVLFFIADFGFFLFVLLHQARSDLLLWKSHSHAPSDRRILWLLFAGVAIPGFLLGPPIVQSNNDLGRHAGMCMRFVLLLWSAPLVAEYLAKIASPRPAHIPSGSAPATLLRRLAVCAFVLGLLGQVWQAGIGRFDLPLVDAGSIPAYHPAIRVPNIGIRFNQIHLAMQAAAQATPPDGVVQANPHGRMAPVYLLYTERQMAASDDGCNVPFGGDIRRCAPIARALIELFGGTGPSYQGASFGFQPYLPFNPATITVANFRRVCGENRLSALVATYSDPAWKHRESWVWQLQPLYANATARVFACNATPSDRP